jgi:predicted permease
MRRLRGWLLRLGGLFARERHERDLSAEMESHLQMHIEDNLRAGMSVVEARREALMKLGGVEQTKEFYRQRRGLPLLETVFQDLRFAARMLLKNPGFTALAVTIMALGIGANTVIFSLVDVVLFRPLPIAKPSEIVRLASGRTRGEARSGFVSFADYLLYRDHADAFSSMASYLDRLPVNVSAGKLGSERIDAGMITGNYFQTLGIRAALGRVIVPEDDNPGAAPVVMLSRDFWRRRFSADANVLGATVIVDGQQFTIVGITPSGFGGVSFENLPEIWLPMSQAFQIDPLLRSQIPLRSESFSPFAVVARLKPGISIEQAQVQLDALAADLGAGKSQPGEGAGFLRPWPVLVPASEAARHDRARYSFLVLSIVVLILLIACADAAGLLLARAEARQKEVAMRLALGATRFRIIRLYLMEGLLVSFLGALVGGLLANWGARLLAASAPSTLPIPLERASSILDLRILAFTALVAIFAGILSSLAPALRYSRSDLVHLLKADSSAVNALTRRVSLRNLLVVAQVAAAVLLLVGAGLFTRTLWQASHVQLGFDPDHTVAASTDPIRQGYDKTAAAGLLAPLLESLRAQPGVQSAALGSSLPLQGGMGTVVAPEGHQPASGEADWVQVIMASPGYFTTVGVPMLSGRDFTSSDAANFPGVAIINETMAREYWPGKNPIGKRVENVGPHDQFFVVVGTVGNLASEDLRKTPGPVVYLPIAQAYLMFPWQPDINLLARTTGDPRALIPAVRAAVARVNPDLPVFRVRTMRDQIAGTLAEERFLARLLFIFAFLATFLCAAGVYGLVSYTTERLTHEFGIRFALGAQPGDVFWMILRRGLLLALAGLVIGLAAATGLTRLLASLLYGVGPADPITYAGVALLVASVTLLASYLPARRAASVDPIVALRYE